MQYQARLAITGAWQGSSRNVLYENMGWESLSDRRTTRRVLQLYKIRANQTPFYLTEKLPPLRGLLYLNTNPHTFRDMPCKTNRYKNSFFPMQSIHGTILCQVSKIVSKSISHLEN